jgi:large subunit ribosomal protein L11
MPPRKAIRRLTLNLAAGESSITDIGKALGPTGVNLGEFRKQYDATTAGQRGHVVPAEVTVYDDRSFSFRAKTPLTASLLRQAAGLDKGAERPNGAPVGWISRRQLRDVATIKLPDLNAIDLDAAERVVAGTARSMGIGVRDD